MSTNVGFTTGFYLCSVNREMEIERRSYMSFILVHHRDEHYQSNNKSQQNCKKLDPYLDTFDDSAIYALLAKILVCFGRTVPHLVKNCENHPK